MRSLNYILEFLKEMTQSFSQRLENILYYIDPTTMSLLSTYIFISFYFILILLEFIKYLCKNILLLPILISTKKENR